MRWKSVLEGMNPYKPGKSVEEVKELYNLDEVVKLASNENPYGAAPAVQNRLSVTDIASELYPDGYASRLRTKMAVKLGVQEEALLFGSGSDELIVIIARALLGPGTNTVMATPTFPQYAHAAKIEGADIKTVPLVEGEHDLEGFLQAVDDETTVIWLCSPNNPTGNLLDSQQLTNFLEKVPEHILVVIDEAYYEYIVDDKYEDTIGLVEKFPNVIVLRTFSKAYGLAAFRIGYGITRPEIATNLNTVRSPFNVTTIGLLLAELSLDEDAFIEQCRRLNREQMVRFVQYAESRNLHMFDSQANFVLLEVPGSADEAAEKLLERGYIVRSGDALGTPGYVRVTVGTDQQNSGLFQAFDALLEGADLVQ